MGDTWQDVCKYREQHGDPDIYLDSAGRFQGDLSYKVVSGNHWPTRTSPEERRCVNWRWMTFEDYVWHRLGCLFERTVESLTKGNRAPQTDDDAL